MFLESIAYDEFYCCKSTNNLRISNLSRIPNPKSPIPIQKITINQIFMIFFDKICKNITINEVKVLPLQTYC